MTDQQDTRVELDLDGTWTDVTDYVLGSGLTIRRGRADEASTADTSSCSLTLKNNDGRFSPRNPTGPYYGQLGRGTRLRVGVGTPAVGDATLGQTGTSIVAPSVTAESAGQMFCVFAAKPIGNLTMPGGMTTTTERDGDDMTCNAARVVVSAGATGTKTATHSTAATEAAAASVWVPGTLTVSAFTEIISAGADGGTSTLTTSVTAGQHMLVFSVWSADPDDRLRRAPQTDDPSTDWVAILDTGASTGIRMRAWIARIDVTDASFTIACDGPGPAAGENYRSVYVIGGADPYYPRFTGEVAEWSPRWDESEALVVVPVDATGVLRRIGQADPLQSPMRRQMALQPGVVAYWPLEDAEGSTSFASGLSGGVPMAFLGTPVLAADDTFLASAPLPTFTAAGARGFVPTHTTGASYYWSMLVDFPVAGTADESMIGSLWSVGGTIARWTLKYDTASPGLRLEAYDRDGVSVLNTAPGPWTPTLPGSRRLVFVEIATNGADVDWTLWVITGLDTGSLDGSFSFGTISTQTKGRINTVAIGTELTLTNDISVGHVFLTTTSPFAGNENNVYGAVAGFARERAGVRARRLAVQLGTDAYVQNVASTASELMGPQRMVPPVDALREVEGADLGRLYEPRGFAGIAYRVHESMENQTSAVTLDYSAGDLAAPLDPTDDDQQLANDVTVSRPDGSSARAVLEEGPLSVLPPEQGGVGRYETSDSANVYADDQLADQAGWRLHAGTVDEARYPQVRVQLAPNTGLVGDVAALDVGDKITLTGLPAWLPPDDVELIVEGYSETIVWPNVWDVTFNCSPASVFDVAQVETDGYERFDSETTTINANISTVSTTVTIAVETGSALWCTTALLPAEFPFDVQVGGEVMTVNSCTTTGAATQSFQVTRSVNGVVKSHTSGAQLRLADPVVFAF
jgi:hypothetical protein